MIKMRNRGLYLKKKNYSKVFWLTGCLLAAVGGGILCVSARGIYKSEDGFSYTSAIVQETKVTESNLLLLEATDSEATEATEPVATEPVPTEVAHEAEQSGDTVPSETATESEVVIVLAANSDSRYPGLILTQDDMDLLINIIWLESRGEPFEGMQGVVEVTYNRVINAKYFPDTIHDVIYDEEIAIQYPTAHMVSTASPTKGQREVYSEAIEKALNGPYVIPVEVVFFGVEPENSNIWGKIGNHYFCYPWYP